MKALFRVFLLGILCGAVFQTARADDLVKMYLDYARFRYDDTQTYLEIYYLLNDTRSASTRTALDVPLKFYLANVDADSLLAASDISVQLPGANGGNGNSLKGSLIKTVLPPGRYEIKMVRMNPMGTSAIDSISYEFAATPFSGEKIKLSDLELASNIKTGSRRKDALFYKNTMEVFPNPTHIYGLENSQLYYYVEVYNIAPMEGAEDLEIQVAIKDKDGNVHNERTYKRSREHESRVENGRFDISELDNGLYTLLFAVVDPTREYSVFNINNFYVLNRDEAGVSRGDPMALYPTSDYFNMPEEEVDLHFAQSRYLATKEEIRIFEVLDDPEAKRVFMFRFWYEREQNNPGLREEYFNRIEVANQRYRYHNRSGWQSDMGRVYILYGDPGQIVRRPNNPDTDPFEVWTYYELEGGVKFLFVDESGFKNYRLMSSTMTGELYDPAWDIYMNTAD